MKIHFTSCAGQSNKTDGVVYTVVILSDGVHGPAVMLSVCTIETTARVVMSVEDAERVIEEMQKAVKALK